MECNENWLFKICLVYNAILGSQASELIWINKPEKLKTLWYTWCKQYCRQLSNTVLQVKLQKMLLILLPLLTSTGKNRLGTCNSADKWQILNTRQQLENDPQMNFTNCYVCSATSNHQSLPQFKHGMDILITNIKIKLQSYCNITPSILSIRAEEFAYLNMHRLCEWPHHIRADSITEKWEKEPAYKEKTPQTCSWWCSIALESTFLKF